MTMFKAIVPQSQRGILYKNGVALRLLEPGVHRFFEFASKYSVVFVDLDKGFIELSPELAALLPPFMGEELVVELGELALLSVDGRPRAVLAPGRYFLFQVRAQATALVKSTKDVTGDVPQHFWPFATPLVLVTGIVSSYERALVYVDGKLHATLGSGPYSLYADGRTIQVVRVDARERELAIVGQDVMTKDHVTLRMNVVVKLAVVDAQKSVEKVQSLDGALYSEAQLVVRRFIASRTVDEVLAARGEAANTMRGELGERSAAWGVEIRALDLKDLILPGEMKVILNRVVEASKQAEANNILRREETAATRSLANTAKMLEQNPMLLRLKELESYKDLAREIDKVTLVVAPNDLASSLKLR
jgi:regulator of protease activity HflC (stomatin/prohibitin superfamily)